MKQIFYTDSANTANDSKLPSLKRNVVAKNLVKLNTLTLVGNHNSIKLKFYTFMFRNLTKQIVILCFQLQPKHQKSS